MRRLALSVICLALGLSPAGAASFAPPGAVAGEPLLVGIANRPADARVELEKAGVEILGFVGTDGWLVRATAERAAALRELPFVACVDGWTPDRKIARSLRDRSDSDAEVQVVVRLFRGTDPAPWAPLIETTPGAKVLSRSEDERGARWTLSVAAGSLDAAITRLTSLRDVAVVEESARLVSFLDDSSWFLQTGIQDRGHYDRSAKLFAHGIDGRGLIAGLIDHGLENDACQFRYASGVDEACWPLGPGASFRGQVPDEEHWLPGSPPPIRTRDRKVVAYYLQEGAQAYDSVMRHGTRVASCIVGDDHSVLADRPVVRDLGERQDVRPFRTGGAWVVGETLRPDLVDVDDPARFDPGFPTTYGTNVQHHQFADGVAPGAQLVVIDVGTLDGSVIGLDQAPILLHAHGTGATAVNESIGGESGCLDCYAGAAFEVDDVLSQRRDLVVCVAAGNLRGDPGPQIAWGAAHAKSAITVGSTIAAADRSCSTGPCATRPARLGEDVSDFSSQGPSSGGRIAPELVAPGELWLPRHDMSPEDGTGTGLDECGVPERTDAGTSLACAEVTGLALLVQQYFQDGFYPSGVATPRDALRPTNALVRAVLVNSARDLGGARSGPGNSQGHRPNMSQGWGAPRLDDTLHFQGDPTIDDPLGDTERAKFEVLTDTPNGYRAGLYPLAPEPGGLTRDRIVSQFRPGIYDRVIHEYVVAVDNPEPSNPVNELRLTLAWSDCADYYFPASPLINDLDLEVISPGPDGILQSSTGDILRGDDVVYRPSPSTAWAGGSSVASSDRRLQATGGAFHSFADRDAVNTVENVFVPASEAVTGAWRVRVIGFTVPGNGFWSVAGRPNYVLGDRPLVFDTDGDGVLDTDFEDEVWWQAQGYALIASGPSALSSPPPPPAYRGPRWGRTDFPGRGRRRPPMGPWTGP